MAVTFAIRGDSMTARYSSGGATPRDAGAVKAVSADAGAIGGNIIDFNAKSGGLHYPGHLNHYIDAPGISILMRVKISTLSQPSSLWHMGTTAKAAYGHLGSYIWPTNNYIRNYMTTATGLAGLSAAQVTTALTDTTDFHDIVMTWDFTTTSGAYEVFYDGTSLGTLTSTRAYNLTEDQNTQGTTITVGAGFDWQAAYYSLNEMIIWNEVIDPTSVGLTSGTGSLNGNSRTAFVDADAYDGAAASGGGGASKIILGGSGFNC